MAVEPHLEKCGCSSVAVTAVVAVLWIRYVIPWVQIFAK